MPMTEEELEEMQAMLAVAKKRPLNFAICMGRKPEDTVVILHRLKDPEILGRQAKKAGDTPKIAFGTIEVKGKKALLTCQSDIPAGIAKSTKKFLTGVKMPLKITVMDATGALAEDDGDPEEADETQDAPPPMDAGLDAAAAAAPPPPPPPPPPAPQGAAWARVETAMAPAVARFVDAGGEKAATVRAAWDGALKAAAEGRFDLAMSVAQKIKPLLVQSAPAADMAPADAARSAPSAERQRYDAILPALQALHDRVMALDPQDADQIEKGWAAMTALAGQGDAAGALKLAAALKARLDAALVAGTAAEAFQQTYLRIGDLYAEAMSFNPPNRAQIESAWALVSDLGFDRREYAKAEAAAAKVEAALRLAIAAGRQGGPRDQDVPPDVAPFAKARVTWSGAKSTMRAELRKLEDKLVATFQSDPDLAELATAARGLSRRLDVFTDELEDSLDAVVNSPPGPERDRLRKQAEAALGRYRAALQDEFFADIDGNNGFIPVDIAGAANRALQEVERVLAS